MFGCDGKPTKDTLAGFLSEATGKSYEDALTELSKPKLTPIGSGKKPFQEIALGFDYRDLVKESPFNPMGKPSKTQVADFMAKETGCSFESAFNELSMIRPTRLENPLERNGLLPMPRFPFLKIR